MTSEDKRTYTQHREYKSRNREREIEEKNAFHAWWSLVANQQVYIHKGIERDNI